MIIIVIIIIEDLQSELWTFPLYIVWHCEFTDLFTVLTILKDNAKIMQRTKIKYTEVTQAKGE